MLFICIFSILYPIGPLFILWCYVCTYFSLVFLWDSRVCEWVCLSLCAVFLFFKYPYFFISFERQLYWLWQSWLLVISFQNMKHIFTCLPGYWVSDQRSNSILMCLLCKGHSHSNYPCLFFFNYSRAWREVGI